MNTTRNLEEARQWHKERGGYLLDLVTTLMVTDDHPCEHRSFNSIREAMDYAMRLAEAGYDETKMPIYESD